MGRPVMNSECPSGKLPSFYHATRRHIQEESSLQLQPRQPQISQRGAGVCGGDLTLLQQSLRDECPLIDGSFYVHCAWRPLFDSFFLTTLFLFETRFTLDKSSILLLSTTTFFSFEQKIETSNSNIFCFVLIYCIICYHIFFWKYKCRLMRPHSCMCVYHATWGQFNVVLHK